MFFVTSFKLEENTSFASEPDDFQSGIFRDIPDAALVGLMKGSVLLVLLAYIVLNLSSDTLVDTLVGRVVQYS